MKRFVLGATLALALSMVGAAYAERYVVVNGQRLSQGEILHLEQWHCGPIQDERICDPAWPRRPRS